MQTKLHITLALMLSVLLGQSQDMTLSFNNARTTVSGSERYYEADIYIASTSGFKLGSGLVYFNYNSLAFGENVKTQGNFEFLQPEGSILKSQHPIIPLGFYTSFIVNDNTTDRVAVSFQQAVSSEGIASNNVTSVASHLFSIRIKYTDITESPGVTFETQSIYLDQFFTACGGTVDAVTNFGSADCTSVPGTQIIDDSFDSTGSEPDSTLGFDNPQTKDFEVAVYPNPVKEYLNVSSPTEGIGSLEFYNLLGRLVKRISTDSKSATVSVRDLPSGLYVLRIKTIESERIVKLVKK